MVIVLVSTMEVSAICALPVVVMIEVSDSTGLRGLRNSVTVLVEQRQSADVLAVGIYLEGVGRLSLFKRVGRADQSQGEKNRKNRKR